MSLAFNSKINEDKTNLILEFKKIVFVEQLLF